MIFFLRTFAKLLARLPERWVEHLSRMAGWALYRLSPQRRRSVMANLRHAFPERSDQWVRQIARESMRQMAESALLAITLPCLPESRLREIFTMPPEARALFARHIEKGGPAVILVPHLGPQEGFCLLPFLLPDMPTLGAIYRPLDTPALNKWILRSRQRFGMQLLSRKEGLTSSIRMLRRGEWVGLLFDQNSGKQGALMTFLDRVASVTELPAILATRNHAPTIYAYAARRSFWRIELCAEEGPSGGERDRMTLEINHWLENLLRRDDQLRPTWLWAHNRWKHRRVPRLGLDFKKNLLAEQNACLHRTGIPRRERFFIRLPNWLGDVVMLIPLLRAMRRSRPDAFFTVIGKSALLPLVEGCGLCEEAIPLPPRGRGYFPFFRRLRNRLPLLHLLFTNSLRGDLEAWLAGAPHRFGMLRPGKKRPLLTRTWRVPAEIDETKVHQVRVWEDFLRNFSLEEDPDFSPVAYPDLPSAPTGGMTIGMICGTENFPAKRWPVFLWRGLISELRRAHPEVRIELFGTPTDRGIAGDVAEGFPSHEVMNLAGQTSLPEFMAHLSTCRLVVSNDTGGMHLANAIGVPVAGLFGPTNPVRTGPVFDAPRLIIQPPGCPATGGASMEEITVEQVLEAVLPLVDRSRRREEADGRERPS